MAFKCYGYMVRLTCHDGREQRPHCLLSVQVMAQALALVSDLKLGLYCKIKPKAMFICQCYGE